MVDVIDVKTGLVAAPFDRVVVKAVVVIDLVSTGDLLLIAKRKLMLGRVVTVVDRAAGQIGLRSPVLHDVNLTRTRPGIGNFVGEQPNRRPSALGGRQLWRGLPSVRTSDRYRFRPGRSCRPSPDGPGRRDWFAQR